MPELTGLFCSLPGPEGLLHWCVWKFFTPDFFFIRPQQELLRRVSLAALRAGGLSDGLGSSRGGCCCRGSHIFICNSISKLLPWSKCHRNHPSSALPESCHTNGSTWLPGGSCSPAALPWGPAVERPSGGSGCGCPGDEHGSSPHPAPDVAGGARLWLPEVQASAVIRVPNYSVIYMLDGFWVESLLR